MECNENVVHVNLSWFLAICFIQIKKENFLSQIWFDTCNICTKTWRSSFFQWWKRYHSYNTWNDNVHVRQENLQLKRERILLTV